MAKQVLDILRAIRWPNLVIAAFVQVVYAFGFLTLDVYEPISPSPFKTLPWILLATLSIMAAGYIHNNLKDLESDRINRPIRYNIIGQYEISFWQKMIMGLLMIASTTLICIYLLSHNFLLIVGLGVPAILLYLYNIRLKHFPVIGNLIIAILCGWIPGIFLLFSWPDVRTWMPADRYLTLALPLFAFLVTWWRELMKDIEDLTGDNAQNSLSLPNLIGPKTALLIAQLLAGFLLGAISIWAFVMLVDLADEFLTVLTVIALIIPLFFIMFLSFKKRNAIEQSRISTTIKWYMIWGIIVLTLLRWLL